MSSPPVVAVIGSTGYVGKCLMPPMLEALSSSKLKELRVLTATEKLGNEQIQKYAASGAKPLGVNFNSIPSVSSALEGVDVVISTLGTPDGIEGVRKTLLEAMEAAKVKIYFPSEFGTNHYKLPSYNHPVFSGKREHYLEARGRGLNPIRMLIGDIMESSFGKWFGLDCNSGVWTVVGNAANVPCAMTAERDIGKFTLEAVLLAHSHLDKCPDEMEVYSDIHTLREYAKVLDSVSGKETKFETVPLNSFKEDFEKSQQFEKLIMIMFAEGAYDYSKSAGNLILNPEESHWKLKKIEEYASETGGIPWKE